MTKQKISLPLAILININIVIGGALFINAPIIAEKSGVLAPLTWIMVGLLLSPLVIILAELAKHYPVAGGLYVYSQKLLNPFWGFVSGWAYFIGTAAGNALTFDAFGKLSRELGFTAFFSHAIGMGDLGIDIVLIIFFSTLNLFNIELLGAMQTIFAVLKTIPILIVIIGGIFLFNPLHFTGTTTSINPGGFIASLPLVLFAYIGIEALCAISHVIKDSARNAPRAILLSFTIIIVIYGLVQFLLIGIHGTASAQPFLEILPKLTANPLLINYGNLCIQLAILSSFLGGFYSMFYTNNWNLYAMAREKAIHFSSPLTKLNRFGFPWTCVIAQGGLVLGFLLLTKKIEILETMSDFGIVIAYLLATISFLAFNKKRSYGKQLIGLVSLASSSYLLWVCTTSLFEKGLFYIVPFGAILSVGMVSYLTRRSLSKA